VPRSRRQIARLPNHAVEAYQFLFASVEFALAAHGGSSVLVTSIGQGDGKTTTALQLGLAAVGDRRRVVLVDGDVRVRGLSQVLGQADAPGLTEVALDGMRSLDAVVQQRIDAATTLPVLPAGQGARDATSLFRTDGYRQAMAELKEHTELLFVDSPPILAVADATVASSEVDGVLLIVDRGADLDQLRETRRRLAFLSTPVLGYVYNRSSSAAAYGYGYGPQTARSGVAARLGGKLRSLTRRSPEAGRAGGGSASTNGAGRDGGGRRAGSTDLTRAPRGR
jgi:Mrp family chromosome partitioning ATPase